MRFCEYLFSPQPKQSLSSTLKRLKTLIEAAVYDTFYVTVLETVLFHLSTLETERFQNDALSKRSTI